MIPRIALFLGGLVFISFGVLFLVTPVFIQTAGVELPGKTGTVEIRAMYGGFEFAFGLFLLLAIRHYDWLRPALIVQTMAFSGLAMGRALGYGLHREADSFMLKVLAGEVLGALISYWGLRRFKDAAHN